MKIKDYYFFSEPDIPKLFEEHNIRIKKQLEYNIRKLINQDIYRLSHGNVARIKLIWARLKRRYSSQILMTDVEAYMDRENFKGSFLDFVQSRNELEKLHKLIPYVNY